MTKARYAKPDGTDGTDARGRGTVALLLALVVNLALAGAGAAVGLAAGATSLLARSAHAATDAGSQVLLLLGRRRAAKTTDDGHPFGYGRDRHFWGLVLSLAFFTAAAGFSVFRGIVVVDRGTLLEDPEIVLAVLGGALALQVALVLTTRRAVRRAAEGASARAYLRQAKQPQLPMLSVQGPVAVVTTLVALAGVGAAAVTDDPVWDGVGSIAIGAVLAGLVVATVIQLKRLLLGTSVAHRDVEALRAAIEIEPEVLRVVHLHAEHLGPEELLLGAKLEVLHDLSVIEVAEVIDRVERNIRANVPAARVIYLEPDVIEEHRAGDAFVSEHAGYIAPDDPDYATITGQVPVVDPDDDIWS
jgi:cation diffusion facilitator family transporter